MAASDDNYNISEVFDSLNNALSIVSRTILSDEYEKAFSRIAEMAESLPAVSSAIIEYQKQVEQRVRELMPAIRAADEYARIMSEQLVCTYKALSFGTTELIERIQKASIERNFSSYVDALSDALRSSRLVAQDFWFIKESTSLQSLSQEIYFPIGFVTALKDTNKPTAERIAPNRSIYYDLSSRGFIDISHPEILISTKEINVVCAGNDLFDCIEEDYISENELIDFMTFLNEKLSFAGSHEVGKKIIYLLQEVANRIDFDENIYYHSRPNKDGTPYTFEDMLRAPNGITSVGRYNRLGQAFYYFSNKKSGSINEIKKHISENTIVQTAGIVPNHPIKMIDLSGSLQRGKKFFDYIRFPSDNSKCPRAYLIPNFVSDCCRQIGIEGIKYYGTKEYSNYVCWNDGYFAFDHMEPLEEIIVKQKRE